jgi:YD repeat-containing protein
LEQEIRQPATASTWRYGYDAMGRVHTVIDPNGLTTYLYYDSLGRLIQTQQPPNTGTTAPTVTGMAYNAQGSLTAVADPRNLATTYTVNGLGRVTAQNSPDTGITTFTHDLVGNVLTSTDARGKTTRYTYDRLDRVTSISYPSGNGHRLRIRWRPQPRQPYPRANRSTHQNDRRVRPDELHT